MLSSDPNNINSDLKIITPSYKTDISKVKNRPTGYEADFLLKIISMMAQVISDIHNGRFGKTPEFPNGVYAYFTSVGLGTASNKLEGVYPYFIGNTYRSPLIIENTTLNQEFDFNKSRN